MSDNVALPLVVDATPDGFRELLAQAADELVMLYLWGPNCPNCEIFAARLPKLLAELDGERLLLVKVNAYEHPELAREYAVFGIPHFVVFKGGRRVGKMSEFKGDAYWLGVVRDNLTHTDRSGTPP